MSGSGTTRGEVSVPVDDSPIKKCGDVWDADAPRDGRCADDAVVDLRWVTEP